MSAASSPDVPLSKITSVFVIDEEPVAVSMRRIVLTIIIVAVIIVLFFYMRTDTVRCDTKKLKETFENRERPPVAGAPMSAIAPPLKFKEKNDADLISETWRSSDSYAQPSYIVASTYAPGDIATIAANATAPAAVDEPLIISYNSNETLTEHELAKNLNDFSAARRLRTAPEWQREKQKPLRYDVSEPNLYGSSYSYMGNLFSEGTRFV